MHHDKQLNTPAQEDKLCKTKMTTRKFNAIRKHSNLGGATFNAIITMLQAFHKNLLDSLAAKQCAELMALCYAQKELGHDEAWEEFKN